MAMEWKEYKPQSKKVTSYELVANFGDGFFRTAQGLRRDFKTFIAGTNMLKCPLKRVHPSFRDDAEGCLT